jgi:hypothetical protein
LVEHLAQVVVEVELVHLMVEQSQAEPVQQIRDIMVEQQEQVLIQQVQVVEEQEQLEAMVLVVMVELVETD